jgi:hypothetical protein
MRMVIAIQNDPRESVDDWLTDQSYMDANEDSTK